VPFRSPFSASVVVRVWLSPVFRSIHGRSARRRLAVKRAQSVGRCGHGPGACEFFRSAGRSFHFLQYLPANSTLGSQVNPHSIRNMHREVGDTWTFLNSNQSFCACI
jgi:hypothetical protein